MEALKTYGWLVLSLVVILLTAFWLVQALGFPLLTRPDALMERGGTFAALLGVGLLIVDVVLPVPASLVMMANGAQFGPIAGTLLSLVGSVGAGVGGFLLGRWGGPLLDRIMSPSERRRATALLERWGGLAIVLTRPLPILAEVTSILAGTSSMRWGPMMSATLVGSLSAATLYSVAGATAARLDSPVLIFIAVLAMAGLFWIVSRLQIRAASGSGTAGKGA